MADELEQEDERNALTVEVRRLRNEVSELAKENERLHKRLRLLEPAYAHKKAEIRRITGERDALKVVN